MKCARVFLAQRSHIFRLHGIRDGRALIPDAEAKVASQMPK